MARHLLAAITVDALVGFAQVTVDIVCLHVSHHRKTNQLTGQIAILNWWSGSDWARPHLVVGVCLRTTLAPSVPLTDRQ